MFVTLSDEDHLDATHIDVKVENGEVILTGIVSDREQKRRAEGEYLFLKN
jgi:osmotically-inducible protein OsmY